MRAAGLWARAELRRAWPSLLVLAVLAGLAGGVVVATVAGAVRAGSSVDRFEAATQTAHVTIFTEQRLGYEARAALDDDPDITATGRMTVMMAAPEGFVPGLDAVTGVGSELGGLQFRPWVTEGRLPRSGEADAVVVSEQAKEGLGLDVGDEVELRYFEPEAGADCREGDTEACELTQSAGSVRVVGVVRTPTDLAENSFQQNVLIADGAFGERLGDDPPVAGYITTLRLARPEDAAEVARRYSLLVGEEGNVLSATGDLDGPRRAVELQRTALLIGAAVAGLAVAVAVGQAFGRHLSRAASQVETLDALGLRWRERTAAATALAVGVAVVAAATSVVVAIAASPIFPFGVARRAEPDAGLRVEWWLLAAAAATMLVVVTAVGAIAAALWARSPRSVRRAASRPGAVREIDVLSGLAPAPATGVRWALLRGPTSRRLPVASTLAAAAGGIGMVVGLIVVAVSLGGLLDTPARYGASWDAAVPVDLEAPVEDATRLAGDPRVDEAALIGAGELTAETAARSPVQLPAVAFEPIAGRLDPVTLEGRVPGAPDEVALGTDTFRSLDVAIGDRLMLFGPGGERRVRVVGRVVLPMVGSADVQRGMVVPLDTFMDLGAAELAAEIDVDAHLLVRLAAGTPVAEYAADLADDTPRRQVERPVYQTEVAVLRDVRAIPLLLGGFTAALAVVAVAHALAVAGRRRSGDVAVLRALGLRPGQAGEVVRWQGITIGIVGLALGVPLGLALGRLVWSAIASSVSVPVVIDLPALPLLAVVVATLAAMTVVAVPPGRRVARLRPADLLRAE
jgi:ABC-type lipoprotein release transport system permease subunit